MVGTLWLWAAPTQNPPGGGGLIKWQKSEGRILISTSTSWAVTTPPAIINFNSQIVTGVPDPINNLDAVNKKYVDQNYGGAAATKIWGQGRPGVAALNNAGECTSSANTNIKVSRGNIAVHWDAAAAGCPADWWVCNQTQRGTRVCGTTDSRSSYNCKDGTSGSTLVINNVDNAWVANRNDVTTGLIVRRQANPTSQGLQIACETRPVWCCAFK